MRALLEYARAARLLTVPTQLVGDADPRGRCAPLYFLYAARPNPEWIAYGRPAQEPPLNLESSRHG